MAPVWLHEDAVDLFEVGGFDAVSDCLQQCAKTEVSGSSEYTLAGADDEIEGIGGEYIVCHFDAVELVEDELGHVIGGQLGDEYRVCDAALDVVVDVEGEPVQQCRLGDEDEVVVFGEVL